MVLILLCVQQNSCHVLHGDSRGKRDSQHLPASGHHILTSLQHRLCTKPPCTPAPAPLFSAARCCIASLRKSLRKVLKVTLHGVKHRRTSACSLSLHLLAVFRCLGLRYGPSRAELVSLDSASRNSRGNWSSGAFCGRKCIGNRRTMRSILLVLIVGLFEHCASVGAVGAARHLLAGVHATGPLEVWRLLHEVRTAPAVRQLMVPACCG